MRERCQHQRCEWRQHREACPLCKEYHYADAATTQVLLVLKALIGRDERVVLALGGLEERPVVQVGPTTLVNGIDAVTRKECSEGSR